MQQGQTANQQLTIGNTGDQALSWNEQTGGVPWVSQNITITNAGGSTLNWMVGTPSETWLSVALTSGSNSNLPGQTSTLTFTIANVNSGNATVVIPSTDGETAKVMVRVSACIQ